MNNKINLKEIIKDFSKFCIKELGINQPFSIQLSKDRNGFETLAYYDKQSNKIAIYIKDRALTDILRSLIHELVHHKQYELKKLNEPNPDIGVFDKDSLNIKADDVENVANAIAGSLIKKYGKTIRSDIYTL